jgi:hypothetical protein
LLLQHLLSMSSGIVSSAWLPCALLLPTASRVTRFAAVYSSSLSASSTAALRQRHLRASHAAGGPCSLPSFPPSSLVHRTAFNEQCAHADELTDQQLLSKGGESAAGSQAETVWQQSALDDGEDAFARQGCVSERFMQRKADVLVTLLRQHYHAATRCAFVSFSLRCIFARRAVRIRCALVSASVAGTVPVVTRSLPPLCRRCWRCCWRATTVAHRRFDPARGACFSAS